MNLFGALRMKPLSRVRVLAMLAAMAMPLALFAHTPLKSSAPADGATVAELSAIAMEFSGPVRLVRVRVMQGEVEIPAGFVVSRTPAATYTIPVPAAPAGEIVVEWAAISADGHAVSDRFSFHLDPGTAAAAGN